MHAQVLGSKIPLLRHANVAHVVVVDCVVVVVVIEVVEVVEVVDEQRPHIFGQYDAINDTEHDDMKLMQLEGSGFVQTSVPQITPVQLGKH